MLATTRSAESRTESRARWAKRGGAWELASDNTAVEPEPWPPDAEVVGEVVWVAQTLVGPRRR